jgi:hypothetical protein
VIEVTLVLLHSALGSSFTNCKVAAYAEASGPSTKLFKLPHLGYCGLSGGQGNVNEL